MSKTLRIHNHIPPEDWAYKGEFTEVVYCTICKTLAMFRDMRPHEPCRVCGNRIRDRLSFSAKWVETTKQKVWWNPLRWCPKRTGYWDLSVSSLADIPDENEELRSSLWDGVWRKKF